jgi:hypothetical protein
VQKHATAPKILSMQRPSLPEVHWLSALHVVPPLPPPIAQLPGGAAVEHWPSFGRWLTGTRPPATPNDEPPLLEPLDPPLEEAPELPPDEPPDEPLPEPPLDPLPEPLPELLPELDASPASPPAPDPLKVVPPQPTTLAAAAKTTSHTVLCMRQPPSNQGATLDRGDHLVFRLFREARCAALRHGPRGRSPVHAGDSSHRSARDSAEFEDHAGNTRDDAAFVSLFR